MRRLAYLLRRVAGAVVLLLALPFLLLQGMARALIWGLRAAGLVVAVLLFASGYTESGLLVAGLQALGALAIFYAASNLLYHFVFAGIRVPHPDYDYEVWWADNSAFGGIDAYTRRHQ